MTCGVIAVAWESITLTVIQNYFAKCGFGIEDAVITERGYKIT
jgi:hypothetical protein